MQFSRRDNTAGASCGTQGTPLTAPAGLERGFYPHLNSAELSQPQYRDPKVLPAGASASRPRLSDPETQRPLTQTS
ncbi:hypothetical protein E2C01_009900 [Portunus trituberculatus]|uniref:Uncharacterized protein n=1 Tax=Portunus trituberculatus TaxID=210409 RepID=A0A5B7D707_PORTR|nr:hypothetical protein [Portunus trituberculatus]